MRVGYVKARMGMDKSAVRIASTGNPYLRQSKFLGPCKKAGEAVGCVCLCVAVALYVKRDESAD